ncbi:MAG: hypothetical protein M0P71_18395 [Melioribacteraceae bacterium]|jgi:hypothetical protein|nr:hypothetical protein [Melioribacteraceae bacterium]
MNKKYLIILFAILAIFLVSTIFLCCQTYKPIWIKDIPIEYNMILNTNKMYFDSKDKSGAMPQIELYIKRLHRMECQAEVFGTNEKGLPNPVNYDDSKLYRNYSQCLQELK